MKKYRQDTCNIIKRHYNQQHYLINNDNKFNNTCEYLDNVGVLFQTRAEFHNHLVRLQTLYQKS